MKTKSSAEINEVIKAKFGTMSYREIGEMVGLDSESVRARARRMGLTGESKPKLPINKQVEKDILDSKLSRRLQEKNEKYSYLIKENDRMKQLLSVLEKTKNISTYSIKGSKEKIGDAVAVIVASDWHFGEEIDPEQIDNLNEYNFKIAHERAKKFFTNSVRLIHGEQKKSSIKKLVLAILGDMISGSLREESLETNEDQVTIQLMEVQKAIISGIQYLLDNTDVEIDIPCHSGNHGRATKERRIASEAGNSWEYYMYHNIADHFRNEKRVKFLIAKGYLSYYDINGFILRFHHGHNIKYGGGIGGIFIPAFKAISQWNKGRVANLDVFGHFHQVKDGGNFVSNGSLCGYNDFALSIKADFEKPKQLFFLVNCERKEKTTTCPIWCE